MTQSRLRPLSIGELLSAGFRLYRRKLPLLLAITAIAQAPIIMLQIIITLVYSEAAQKEFQNYTQNISNLLNRGPVNPLLRLDNYMAQTIGLQIVNMVNLLVMGVIGTAIAYAITQLFAGNQVTVRSAYNIGGERWRAVIGSGLVWILVLALVVGGMSALSIFGLRAAFITGGGIDRSAAIRATLVGFVVMGVVILLSLLFIGLVWLRFTFYPQVIAVESSGFLQSLIRSWRLVQGYFWRTLGVIILTYLLSILLFVVPGLILATIVDLVIARADIGFGIRQAISQLLAGVIGGIFGLAFNATMMSLYYFDLRVRKEGYNLAAETPIVIAEAPSGA